MTRIDAKFEDLRARGKKAFVSYVMAGDPDFDRSLEIVRGLPAAGVDIIELGLPFTDPMADGPTIQLAGQRALEAGMTLNRTLEMVRAFRENDDTTFFQMTNTSSANERFRDAFHSNGTLYTSADSCRFQSILKGQSIDYCCQHPHVMSSRGDDGVADFGEVLASQNVATAADDRQFHTCFHDIANLLSDAGDFRHADARFTFTAETLTTDLEQDAFVRGSH